MADSGPLVSSCDQIIQAEVNLFNKTKRDAYMQLHKFLLCSSKWSSHELENFGNFCNPEEWIVADWIDFNVCGFQTYFRRFDSMLNGDTHKFVWFPTSFPSKGDEFDKEQSNNANVCQRVLFAAKGAVELSSETRDITIENCFYIPGAPNILSLPYLKEKGFKIREKKQAFFLETNEKGRIELKINNHGLVVAKLKYFNLAQQESTRERESSRKKESSRDVLSLFLPFVWHSRIGHTEANLFMNKVCKHGSQNGTYSDQCTTCEAAKCTRIQTIEKTEGFLEEKVSYHFMAYTTRQTFHNSTLKLAYLEEEKTGFTWIFIYKSKKELGEQIEVFSETILFVLQRLNQPIIFNISNLDDKLRNKFKKHLKTNNLSCTVDYSEAGLDDNVQQSMQIIVSLMENIRKICNVMVTETLHRELLQIAANFYNMNVLLKRQEKENLSGHLRALLKEACYNGSITTESTFRAVGSKAYAMCGNTETVPCRPIGFDCKTGENLFYYPKNNLIFKSKKWVCFEEELVQAQLVEKRYAVHREYAIGVDPKVAENDSTKSNKRNNTDISSNLLHANSVILEEGEIEDDQNNIKKEISVSDMYLRRQTQYLRLQIEIEKNKLLVAKQRDFQPIYKSGNCPACKDAKHSAGLLFEKITEIKESHEATCDKLFVEIKQYEQQNEQSKEQAADQKAKLFKYNRLKQKLETAIKQLELLNHLKNSNLHDNKSEVCNASTLFTLESVVQNDGNDNLSSENAAAQKSDTEQEKLSSGAGLTNKVTPDRQIDTSDDDESSHSATFRNEQEKKESKEEEQRSYKKPYIKGIGSPARTDVSINSLLGSAAKLVERIPIEQTSKADDILLQVLHDGVFSVIDEHLDQNIPTNSFDEDYDKNEECKEENGETSSNGAQEMENEVKARSIENKVNKSAVSQVKVDKEKSEGELSGPEENENQTPNATNVDSAAPITEKLPVLTGVNCCKDHSNSNCTKKSVNCKSHCIICGHTVSSPENLKRHLEQNHRDDINMKTVIMFRQLLRWYYADQETKESKSSSSSSKITKEFKTKNPTNNGVIKRGKRGAPAVVVKPGQTCKPVGFDPIKNEYLYNCGRKHHYSCDVCDKYGFHYESSRNRHKRTHETNNIDFECEICHKVLKHRVTYNAHVRQHQRQPLKCKYCEKVYVYALIYKKHVQKCKNSTK